MVYGDEYYQKGKPATWGGYEPPPPKEVYEPTSPEAGIQRRIRGELTGDEYLYWNRAIDLVTGWIQSGRWTPEQGEAALERIDQHLTDMGVSPNTYLYEQVWTPIASQRKAEEAQLEQAGLQRVQRGRVLEARQEFNEYVDYILKSDKTYEEKQSALLNTYYSYADEAMLPEGYAQDLMGAVSETLSPAEQQKRRWGPPEPTRVARPAPPRYEPAFEEMRAGLQGPQPWRQWFEQSYSRILRQYQVTEAEPTEKSWAEYLKRKKPELKEEWWSRGAWARGERPSAFAPRVTTVRF